MIGSNILLEVSFQPWQILVGFRNWFLWMEIQDRLELGRGMAFVLRGRGHGIWPNPVFAYEFVLNEKEVYYEYKLINTTVFLRYVVNPSGVAQRFNWVDRTQSWVLFFTPQADKCENYGLCGVYATCNINNSPVCACLKGFLPKSPKQWDSADWSDGCVRRTPLECNDGDGFLKRTRVKLPDTSSSWYNKSMHDPPGMRRNVFEKLLLHSICKFRCQRWRKRLRSLVSWPCWYYRIRRGWARPLYKNGHFRTGYDFTSFFFSLDFVEFFFFFLFCIILNMMTYGQQYLLVNFQ